MIIKLKWTFCVSIIFALCFVLYIGSTRSQRIHQIGDKQNVDFETVHRKVRESGEKPKTEDRPTLKSTTITTRRVFINAPPEPVLNNRTNNSEQDENTTTAVPITTTVKPDCPTKDTAQQEHASSLTIFFILLVIAICILCVHLLIQTKFHYVPESVAMVLIGAFIGLFLSLFEFGNWKNEEAFPPTIFFIVLLPPIIFESGYNLHKGNFFQNIGSILVFAVFGTVLSALTIAGGIYLLGQAGVAYKLNLIESFAFGSLISAVDPVATLAIFHALDVDPILYMLVFGESVLNDAVSIVLTTTVLEFQDPAYVVAKSGAAIFFHAVGRFCLMFFGSAAIGVSLGLVSALTLKHLELHKTPSLEFGLMFIFSYLPYGLAEGIHLSGIMAILFAGITMSHYTHNNLSPITQITIQQTFRTVAFIAETSVFAYQGLAIFSFNLDVRPAFTVWSLALILIGRAINIFPLSYVVNFFREHKITRKMQFIMWFSGLRGAIAFALSLHLDFKDGEIKSVLVTTTLIIVLFTLLFLGGATMPMMKLLNAEKKQKKKSKRLISLSKTKEMGEAVDSEHLSELTEEEYEINFVKPHLKGFLKFDAKYLVPFFTRRFTKQQVRDGRTQMDKLTDKWYQDVRAAPSESESEEEPAESVGLMTTTIQ
ncbi:sodium/hydrogen exchanger 8 isoform X2 [Patella vulgata]|uniref:sodium/hydrogen exchanger 8 isoform X2 n=1 Tax=Patella vulgata TaxID=6465 RepID=UPI00217F27B3|nr:sodium/hydrogen exchanger 8 isoform X2 [Patella vulgata]